MPKAIESKKMRNNKRRFNNNDKRTKNICGVVTVTSDECHGDPDKMVRRFIKKVKNEGIVEQVRERKTFTKPSEVRRLQKAATRKVIEKVNKQRQVLFNPGERKLPRNRRK